MADKSVWREIAFKVHGQIWLRLRQYHESGGSRHVERVAVRLSRRGGLCGNEPRGAIAVDDRDLPPPALGEAIGDEPRDHVGATARGRLDDDRHVSRPDTPRRWPVSRWPMCREMRPSKALATACVLSW